MMAFTILLLAVSSGLPSRLGLSRVRNAHPKNREHTQLTVYACSQVLHGGQREEEGSSSNPVRSVVLRVRTTVWCAESPPCRYDLCAQGQIITSRHGFYPAVLEAPDGAQLLPPESFVRVTALDTPRVLQRGTRSSEQQ